jgi:hypothetical protein
MGECPPDYATYKAAQFCGAPVWELVEKSVVYKYKALAYMSAEAEAQEILANHRK